jgi:LemA protein
MFGAGIVIVVVIGLFALIGIYAMGVYNGLVKLRNMFRNAFSQIDVQLKRRHDLIPNLVETAKAYMAHESGTLEAVIAARNGAESARQAAAAHPGDAAALQKLGAAEAGLGGVLGRLFAVSEAYPDLKANQNMMQLTEELTTTENKVAFSRQAYNDSVLATISARFSQTTSSRASSVSPWRRSSRSRHPPSARLRRCSSDLPRFP